MKDNQYYRKKRRKERQRAHLKKRHERWRGRGKKKAKGNGKTSKSSKKMASRGVKNQEDSRRKKVQKMNNGASGLLTTATFPVPDHEREDYHHILYQQKHWRQGYAKLLREHPYMGMRIPQGSLHGIIHSKIHDVPVPKGKDCKRAYFALEALRQKRLIDCRNDPLEERLDFLIELWRDSSPVTVAVLKWQRDIIATYHPCSATG